MITLEWALCLAEAAMLLHHVSTVAKNEFVTRMPKNACQYMKQSGCQFGRQGSDHKLLMLRIDWQIYDHHFNNNWTKKNY